MINKDQSAQQFKEQFLLNPDIIFLNHGSFGATPRYVFTNYLQWQMQLEHQPVLFLGREISSYLAESRRNLSEYLHTHPDNLVYVTNATHGLNIIARSMHLGIDDEVLTTNHEYGAIDRTWRFLSQQLHFKYETVQIDVPVTTKDDFLDRLFSKVTSKTKIIFLSHITSPTALIFPVKDVCLKARERGILTVVDGAHAPGQIDVNLDEIGADFYVGNLHKWLCAPKGSAFIYARPEVQNLIEPLVVSWGWESENPGVSHFQDYLEWTGTQDFSAYLAVPSAIEFQKSNNWTVIQQQCHEYANRISQQINETFAQTPLSINDSWYGQMVSMTLPDQLDSLEIKNQLYDEFHIEVPIMKWNNKTLLRVSVQAYNTWDELQILCDSLKTIFHF